MSTLPRVNGGQRARSLRTAVILVLFLLALAAVLAVALAASNEPSSTTFDSIESRETDFGQHEEGSTSRGSVPAVLRPMPECREVWRVGRFLPVDYQGCRTDEVTYASARWRCETGSGRVASSPDRSLHAQPGGLIIPGRSSQVACRQ